MNLIHKIGSCGLAQFEQFQGSTSTIETVLIMSFLATKIGIIMHYIVLLYQSVFNLAFCLALTTFYCKHQAYSGNSITSMSMSLQNADWTIRLTNSQTWHVSMSDFISCTLL